MGWGWGRYGGYGGYGRSAPKATKASAATLSTATLQRVLAQKAAEEEAAVRYQLQHQQHMRDSQAAAVEEARLVEQHGGKEQLAKWRVDNAERLQQERLAKMEAERKAAGEQAVVVEIAELRVELASLQRSRRSSSASSHFQLNKAATKAAFHLTDKDLGALPQIVATSGRSKILYASADIFAAVTRKEGKKQLRRYQAGYNPDLARRFVEEELAVLERKQPELIERGRKEAVERLRQSDDAAIFAEKKCGEAIEAALANMRSAGDKREQARAALLEVATREEVMTMGLVNLPGEEEEDDDDDARGMEEGEAAEEVPAAAVCKPKAAPKPRAVAVQKKRAAGESMSEGSMSEGSMSEEEEEEEDDDEDDYVVEEVLDSKQEGRKVLYLVKWEGFDGEEDNTWEPQKNLDDCLEKLEAYWKASPESAGARQHAEELQLKSKPKGGASASSSASSGSPSSVPKEPEAPAGPRTLTKRAGKEAATPVTAPGPAKKKARVSEAGPSSAAAGRPSRAAASAANDKMDTLIKAGSSGIMVD